MNANELADEFKNRDWDEVDCVLWCEKSANMLRQQQAEIEALKKQLDTRTKELIGASFYEHDYKTMMANSEPVAWMSQGGDVSRSADYFVEMGFTDLIPLYTHPVKELTAQEVMEQTHRKISEAHWKVKELTDEEIAQEWGKFYPDVFHTHLIDFARAILRKAQEK